MSKAMVGLQVSLQMSYGPYMGPFFMAADTAILKF